MQIRSKDFLVREDKKVNLKKWPTLVKPVYKSRQQYEKLLRQHVRELSEKQQLLYAHDRYAVLLIFQAMDAAGKDGAIKHVMSGVNPQGCQVFSFKHPSARNWITISSGAPRRRCRNAAASASSTGPTTKRC